MERKITCDFKEEPLEEALAFLDSLGKVGFTMEAAPVEKLRITLQLKDEPFQKVFSRILAQADLALGLRDNRFYVASRERMAALRSVQEAKRLLGALKESRLDAFRVSEREISSPGQKTGTPHLSDWEVLEEKPVQEEKLARQIREVLVDQSTYSDRGAMTDRPRDIPSA